MCFVVNCDAKINMKLFKRSMSLVLAAVLLLSCVYTGAVNVQAAVDTYVASCTAYPANLSVLTTEPTSLMTYPCTSDTESDSAVDTTVPVNTMLSVTALYENTAGEYWYKVLYYGSTLYVDATATALRHHMTGDVKISNVASPASLTYGDVFSIKGDISSSINELGTITASMHVGSNITPGPCMSASADADGQSYSLLNSTIDYNMTFNTLDPGVYTYMVTAEAISYYIDDNDALATSTRDVVLETQECVVTDWENPNKELAMGIDVSDHNGEIDWSKAAEEIDFAIIRASWEYTADTTFAANTKGCIDNDIPFGVYVYSYAENAEEAVLEAEYVLNLIKGYHMDLPVWFYMGDEVHKALTSEEKQAIVKAFCDTVAEAGYQPGLYSYLSWFTSDFTDSYFDSLPKWVIQIDNLSTNNASTYDGGTWMWKYSLEGTVSGVSGNIGCNYYYAELPGISSDTSYLSQCKYYSSHAYAATNTVVHVREFPSTDYASYGTIATNSPVEITGLYRNTANEYWYQVISGSNYGYIRSDLLEITEFLFDDIAVIHPAMASELKLGYGYPLTGEMVSLYNNIHAVSANVYSGEDTHTAPVLNSSTVLNSKYYNLYRSVVCTDLVFNDLTEGHYTYELAANIRNYYVSGGYLIYRNKDVAVWSAPFDVKADESEVDILDYYLFGYINGADYACEADYENMGEYKFVDGKLTATFTEDSYVAVKAEDNQNWYMTSGWQGFDATSATLYNTTTTQENSDKLFVPGGVEVTFTLINKGDDTFTLSYEIPEVCDHSYTEEITTPADCETEGVKTFTCSKCGDSYTEVIGATGHSYVDGICSVCGTVDPEIADPSTTYYLFGYINDANYGCEEDYENLGEYRFENGKVTAIFTKDSYVALKTGDNANWYMTNGWLGNEVTSAVLYNTTTLTDANKLFVPAGYVVNFTLVDNGDDTFTLSYTVQEPCDHSYTEEITTAAGCETKGVKTYTCSECGDSYTESIAATGHSYTDGSCSVCGKADPEYVDPSSVYYLIGYINGANYGCEEDYENLGDYKFVDGTLTVTFESDSYVFIKTGDNVSWFMAKEYISGNSGALYNTSTVTASEKMLVPGGVEVTFTLVVNEDGSLTLSYTTDAGEVEPDPEPTTDYYLIGYINGANYGCEEDHANIGEYKFVDGKLTVTFTSESYVFVKTGDNANWYMAQEYISGNSGTLHNTSTGASEKMYVPGGVEVTFTLVENSEGTLHLSYTVPASIVPTLTPHHPSLSFEGEVFINVYFNATNIDDVVEMGLVTSSDATVDENDTKIPGYEHYSDTMYIARTNGIAAKNLGDTIYFRTYAKLADGTYVYSEKTYNYSALDYAKDRLANSTNAKMKALAVAMLNYGAAAQVHFGYNTNNLMNASLTADQLALVEAYRSDMVTSVAVVDSSKVGAFTFNSAGYSSRRPSVSFEGAFAINYYFAPKLAVDNGMTLYYWTQAAYDSAEVLTTENASGTITMELLETGEYTGTVTGIAAKDIDATIFVAGVYESNGVSYATGVLPYSLGSYCVDRINNSTSATMVDFAKATAVYGYYAKEYFTA